jgi:hypothetical protein
MGEKGTQKKALISDLVGLNSEQNFQLTSPPIASPIIMMSKPKSSRNQTTQLKFWNHRVKSPDLAPNKDIPTQKLT